MNEHVMKPDVISHQNEDLVAYHIWRNGVVENAVVTTIAHTTAPAEPPSGSEGSTQVTSGNHVY